MKRYLVIIALAAIVSGCGVSCYVDRDRSGVDALEKNRQLWRKQNMENYVMLFDGIFYSRVRISVANGEIVLIQKVLGDGSIGDEVAEERYADYFIVDSLFTEIVRLDKEVDRLDVEFDPVLGYPSYVYVDREGLRCNCLGMCTDAIDDEHSYTVQLETSL